MISNPRFFKGCVPFVLMMVTLIIYENAVGQISQPTRYERSQRNSDHYFHVVPLKEEGLALFRNRDKYKNGKQLWELVFIDTTLHETKSYELEIDDRHKLSGYEVIPGHVYFLYRTGDTPKSDFELIETTAADGEVRRFDIKPDLDFKLTHFSKAGDYFVFGGYVNNEPAIFLYNLTNGLIKVLPGFFQKDTELIDLRVNQNYTFNVVMIDRGTRGERKLTFRTFDDKGELLLEDIVPIDENKSLQTGITSTLEREDLLVFGNWGEKNSKQSKGFFSLPIDPFADQKIQYVNFGSLNHFLDYLSPKRAQRLKEATKEDEDAGKIPSFSAYVMPYKITETKDGYLMLAEVYSPNASVNPYYSSPYYYNPYYYGPAMGYGSYYRMRPYQPYPYNTTKSTTEINTHATVLVAYDGKGKLLWDYSAKLDQIDMPSTEQATDFCMVNNKVIFLYKKEYTLKFKSIGIKDDQTADISEEVKPLEVSDEIRSEKETEGGVRYWYGNTFYVWGYQTIRNTTKEDRVRDVFYINKVNAN
jgi:hypothetical protein